MANRVFLSEQASILSSSKFFLEDIARNNEVEAPKIKDKLKI